MSMSQAGESHAFCPVLHLPPARFCQSALGLVMTWGDVVTVARNKLNRAGTTVAGLGLLLTAGAVPSAHPTPVPAKASASSVMRSRVASRLGRTDPLSSGLRAWLAGPPSKPASARRTAATPSIGTNVDANDPALDLGAGQSETAVAAQRRGASTLLLVGWNDASGMFGVPTTASGSLTGVAVSGDGGRHFTDLIGLPNQNPDQHWSGDPSIAALGDGRHFAVSSLYYPSTSACSDGRPAYGTIAVSMATANAAGTSATLSLPVPVTLPGNLCSLGTPGQPSQLSTLDKDWISFDPASRTLAVSYTRFFFPPPPVCGPNGCTVPPGSHTGTGQIEVIRAHVPTNPAALSTVSFTKPVVAWGEEPACPAGRPSSEKARCGAADQGAYVGLAPGGDAYLGWERNTNSNSSGNGDPSVYIHAALVPARASQASVGGPSHPVVLSAGQPHANPSGGVKSLDTVSIAGYDRGPGQDFPRLAINTATRSVVFVWNDASLHPLGDIWLRTAPLGLAGLGKTVRVNDDSSYGLHFLPAVSVRSNGSICTSWYDRRLGGANSTRTDYFADCRATAGDNSRDIRVTTGATDWAATSSLIFPSFGDYTDNATDGTHTYFAWSDGRLGIPQPFIDHR